MTFAMAPGTLGAMAKKRRSSGKARGAALTVKAAPQTCKTGLSQCMKGGGRKKAGTCMRWFNRCIGR